MQGIERLNNHIERYRVIGILMPLFLFFQPFNHFAGVRNTAFVLLLLIFLIRLFSRRIRINWHDRTVQALALLVSLSILSAALSPYALESFHSIRKNLFYQVVIFLIIISEYRSLKDLMPLIYAIIGGFAALTILVLLKNSPHTLLHWLEYTDKKYTKGYSLFGSFYIPLTIAYIYSTRESLRIKSTLIAVVFVEFILCLLNNHRGQIAAIVISAAIITLAARRFITFIIGVAACLVIGLLLFIAKPDIYDRYETLLMPDTYFTNQYSGWNNRLAIWSGTIDMIEKRPLTGYGYGWKKIATVVKDGAYLEKWGEKNSSYKYFKGLSYGQANPHNLVLQLLFEIGFLGLGAFLFFWFTIIIKATSASKKSGPAADFLKFSVGGVLISYALVNVANGLWEESIGMMMITFAAIVLTVHRDLVNKNENY